MKRFWICQLILLSYLKLVGKYQLFPSCLHEFSVLNGYLSGCWTQKIKAMVVPFRVWNLANTRPLEQVSSYSCPRNSPTLVKLYLNKFTKSTTVWYHDQYKYGQVFEEDLQVQQHWLEKTKDSNTNMVQLIHIWQFKLEQFHNNYWPWVVVPNCFGIAKCFQNWIWL